MKWTTVLTTSGNPDFAQYAPITDPEMISVDSYDELLERIKQWRSFWMVGMGNWMEPTVLRDGQPLGFLTMNNRLMRYEIEAIPDEDIYGKDATVEFDDYRIDTEPDDWWEFVKTESPDKCVGQLRDFSGNIINCFNPALFYSNDQNGRDLCFNHMNSDISVPVNYTHDLNQEVLREIELEKKVGL